MPALVVVCGLMSFVSLPSQALCIKSCLVVLAVMTKGGFCLTKSLGVRAHINAIGLPISALVRDPCQ